MGLAQSFGAKGYSVDSPEALQPALRQAIAEDKPALIEVVVDPEEEISPWGLLVRV
jgi:acetolactate synthase-1/2/3 large subunit